MEPRGLAAAGHVAGTCPVALDDGAAGRVVRLREQRERFLVAGKGLFPVGFTNLVTLLSCVKIASFSRVLKGGCEERPDRNKRVSQVIILPYILLLERNGRSGRDPVGRKSLLLIKACLETRVKKQA